MRNRAISGLAETFPKSNRLLKWKNFHFNGEVCRKKVLKASYKNNLLGSSRLGIVVSKRISKSAVVRNKIKRILRESFRKSVLRDNKLDLVLIVTGPYDASSNSFYEQLKNTFLNIEKEILWAQTKREA